MVCFTGMGSRDTDRGGLGLKIGPGTFLKTGPLYVKQKSRASARAKFFTTFTTVLSSLSGQLTRENYHYLKLKKSHCFSCVGQSYTPYLERRGNYFIDIYFFIYSFTF